MTWFILHYSRTKNYWTVKFLGRLQIISDRTFPTLNAVPGEFLYIQVKDSLCITWIVSFSTWHLPDLTHFNQIECTVRNPHNIDSWKRRIYEFNYLSATLTQVIQLSQHSRTIWHYRCCEMVVPYSIWIIHKAKLLQCVRSMCNRHLHRITSTVFHLGVIESSAEI